MKRFVPFLMGLLMVAASSHAASFRYCSGKNKKGTVYAVTFFKVRGFGEIAEVKANNRPIVNLICGEMSSSEEVHYPDYLFTQYCLQNPPPNRAYNLTLQVGGIAGFHRVLLRYEQEELDVVQGNWSEKLEAVS